MSGHQKRKPPTKAEQKRNRKLARDIFTNGPEQGLTSEIWGRHSPTRDFAIRQRKENPSIRDVAVQLWRTEKRFLLGSQTAICDAFEICKEQDWPLPSWLQDLLAARYPLAMFDQEEFRAKIPRVGQTEKTRIQIQKHTQLFWALKYRRLKEEESYYPPSVVELVYNPSELHNVPEQRFEKAVTDVQKVNLVSSILRANKLELRSSTPDNIEVSLKAAGRRTDWEFGSSLGVLATPYLYLWDAPFLHPNTLRFINSL